MRAGASRRSAWATKMTRQEHAEAEGAIKTVVLGSMFGLLAGLTAAMIIAYARLNHDDRPTRVHGDDRLSAPTEATAGQPPVRSDDAR